MKLPPPDYEPPPIQAYYEVDGLHHETREPAKFFINLAHVLHLLESSDPVGPSEYYDSLLLISGDALKPEAVLEGLNRKNFEDGLCYCTAPKLRWISDDDGEKIPAPDGVFCVYLKPIPEGYKVLKWEWRAKAPGQLCVPIGWERDFQRMLWPRK